MSLGTQGREGGGIGFEDVLGEEEWQKASSNAEKRCGGGHWQMERGIYTGILPKRERKKIVDECWKPDGKVRELRSEKSPIKFILITVENPISQSSTDLVGWGGRDEESQFSSGWGDRWQKIKSESRPFFYGRLQSRRWGGERHWWTG